MLSAISTTTAAKVILHLSIQLLSRLLRPSTRSALALLASPATTTGILLPSHTRPATTTLPRRTTTRQRRPRIAGVAVPGIVGAQALPWAETAVVAAASSAPSPRRADVVAAIDALEHAPAGLLDAVEERAALGAAAAAVAVQLCQADGLAVGVGAVEFAHGDAGVARVFVGYKGGALRAVGAVVEQAGGEDEADAVEEFLLYVSDGVVVFGYLWSSR